MQANKTASMGILDIDVALRKQEENDSTTHLAEGATAIMPAQIAQQQK